MSPFERLLQELPPERRVEAALALEKLSHDHHSPIYDLYAEILAGIHAKNQAMETRMEQRANQRDGQLSKVHAEGHQTIRQEIGRLSGTTLWRRIIVSRVTGAIIWVLVVASLTNHIIKTKVLTVDPVFLERLETLESKINGRIDAQAQLQNLRISHLMDLGRETCDTISKTHVTTASQTLIGKSLSLYVTRIDEKMITLEVDKRRITVRHNLTPQEFLQLNIALQIARKIQ